MGLKAGLFLRSENMSDGVVLAFVITLGALCVTSLGAVIRARRSAAPQPPAGRVAHASVIVLILAALLVLALVVLGISIL